MKTNYTNNKLSYKRENKVQTPNNDNIEVVGGLWEEPIAEINGNLLRAEIAFKNADNNFIWSPLRSYNFETQQELDAEMDAIIIKIKEGKFDESGK